MELLDGNGNGSGTSGQASDGKAKKPGHGKKGAKHDPDAKRVAVPLEGLAPGDKCPECRTSPVYQLPPAEVLRIFGQPPLVAFIFELERVRCSGCLAVQTAPLPAEAGAQRYDATAKSMIAILNYCSGQPFNRAQVLQGWLGAPVPRSTQIDQVESALDAIHPVYEELQRQAAALPLQGHDDTRARVREISSQIKGELAAAEPSGKKRDVRTGVQTTGVVAKDEASGRTIRLFFTGRQHAGENLGELLEKRPPDLPPPIKMADALSANAAAIKVKTQDAACMDHARRNFKEIEALFPIECAHALGEFGLVYKADAEAKMLGLNGEERLSYHIEKSAPVMERLFAWCRGKLDAREIEPNSPLGGAVRYLENHWEKLTLFLRVPGVPLSNVECERLLKTAVVRRKNSLFYMTEFGAKMGDAFMSVIQTAVAAGVNPFKYLTALQQNQARVKASPATWLPWNYELALANPAQS